MTTERSVATETEDPGVVTRQQWKWSVLAGMASYLDAGSIVALGASLALWREYLGLSATLVGTLAAVGPNAVGAGIGAFVGGRLGDLVGRKKIYQYDLIVYAIGVLLMACSVNTPMLVIGTTIVGLAVGADVPTSLALVGEFAPAGARGRLLGFSQIAWNAGPVVVLLLALVTTPFGINGARVLFVMLFVVAVVTYLLRRGMVESARWTEAVKSTADRVSLSKVADLFRGANLRALAWTAIIYIFWNLAAGTSGIFTPYIITSLHAGSQAASVALSAAGFLLGILGTVFIFMPLSDRGHVTRRTMWLIGAVMQVAAYAAFLALPFSIPVILANIVLFGIGSAMAGEAVYKTFSQELFPTMLRGTAQGVTFGTARLLLGIWSFFVPVLAATGIRPVAALLTLFLLISGIVGYFWMPNTAGKSLETIEEERQGAPSGRASAGRS